MSLIYGLDFRIKKAYMEYKLSEIDLHRFGVITAKATLNDTDKLSTLNEKSRSDQVKFLIIRVPTDSLTVAQSLEFHGAVITDTLVYYQNSNIGVSKVVLPNGYSSRYAQLDDAASLEVLALDVFSNYIGHYHSDTKLKKQDCDRVYSSWAANSCLDRSVADKVILIERNRELVAFATLKINCPEVVEGLLFGVSPKHRKIGLHACLMKLALNWCSENGYKRLITSTQINNIYVQKNWTRLGFELIGSYYTFHKWFK